MLELICDHRYTWKGLPADQSPYRHHGKSINTGGAYDGAEPGSGVVTFPQANSRIRIAPGSGWQPLTALKIEVVARVDPRLTRSSVLVAGAGSFRFGLSEGALEAQFVNAAGSNNYVRSADAFAPDHKYRPVPLNRWVTLGWSHDGFAKMRLFIDGEMVGEATINGGVPPVAGLGVAIGNAVDQDDAQFPGEIDEVKIWRLDPRAMKREFLRRPYTPKEARCWEKHVEKVTTWVTQNGEQHRSLVGQLQSYRRNFIRSLFLLPEREQARLRALLLTAGNLWFAGKIAGPEMGEALREWVAFLRAHGVDPTNDPAFVSLTAAIAELKFEQSAVLQCDLQAAGFLQLLRQTVEECGETRAAR